MLAAVERFGTVPDMTTAAPAPDFSQNIEPTPATANHPYVAAALFLVQHLRTLDEEHPATLGVRRAVALLSAEVLVTEADARALRLAQRIQDWLDRQVS